MQADGWLFANSLRKNITKAVLVQSRYAGRAGVIPRNAGELWKLDPRSAKTRYRLVDPTSKLGGMLFYTNS